MFKEVFRTACTQIALVSEFKMLHDKLQDLQNVYRTIDAHLSRGRARASRTGITSTWRARTCSGCSTTW
jgi:hypothetical protein